MRRERVGGLEKEDAVMAVNSKENRKKRCRYFLTSTPQIPKPPLQTASSFTFPNSLHDPQIRSRGLFAASKLEPRISFFEQASPVVHFALAGVLELEHCQVH